MNSNLKKPLIILASLALVLVLFDPNAQAQILMSGGTHIQDFNTLESSTSGNTNWLDNTTLLGWYAAKQKGGDITNYIVNNGAGTSPGLYSFGSTGNGERALGSLVNNTPGSIAYGVRFQNDTALSMTNITISYTGEQWRRQNTNQQTLAFFYVLSSSPVTSADATGTNYSWIAFTNLNFVSSSTGTGTALLDGNNATNRQVFSSVVLPNFLVLSGQELFLRWLDVDDSGTDHSLAIDDVTVSFQTTAATNTPPSITGISGQAIQANQTTPALAFTVGDLQDSADSLTLDKASSNTSVIPLSNITFGGSNDTRTVTVSAAGVVGTSTVTVRVIDSGGASNSTSFLVTVQPVNAPPTVSQISPTNTLTGVPVAVPFTVSDPETAAGSLTVTPTSLNTNLIPNTGISLVNNGSNRTATVTPAYGRSGVAIINLSVSDATNITSTNFAVMVRPSAGVVLIDDFDYPDGPAIEVSAGLWRHHSGNILEAADVSSGELTIRNGDTEDINAALVGAPYTTNSGFTLYSSFKVTCSELPTSAGNYYAHFMDTNTGADQGFGARVWNSISNAASGFFRFGIGNGINADNTSGQLTNDLATDTNYFVVTRFIPSNGVATIWLNPSSENSPSVTATDIGTGARPNPIDVVAYAFRQNSGEGKLNVDNLRVGLSFTDVMPRLNIRSINNQAVLVWSGPHLLQAAPAVTGSYTNIAGATSPYTNTAIGSVKFFRLLAN